MNRIIFIDGTYGVGKTSVANEITNLIGGKVECIDPDCLYNALVEKNMFFLLTGWPIQNNKLFMRYFRGVVEEKFKDKEVIIPIAITTEICKTELLDYFAEIVEIIHIILVADAKQLRKRINGDITREKELSINNMRNNQLFLDTNFKNEIHIDTTSKSVKEIANIIVTNYLC